MTQSSVSYYEPLLSGPAWESQDGSLHGYDNGYMSSGEMQETQADYRQDQTIDGISQAVDSYDYTIHHSKHRDSRQSQSLSRSRRAADKERYRLERKPKQSHSSSSKYGVDHSAYQDNDDFDRSGDSLSQGLDLAGIWGYESMLETETPPDPFSNQAPANSYDVHLELQTKNYGWRYGLGLRDSGNMAGHLLSCKMFRSLGYSSRDLDDNMDLYGTLGNGEIRTYGAITLNCHDQDRNSTSKVVFNVCEFTILEEYDVIFSRESLPGGSPPTGNPTVSVLKRKRALNDDEKRRQKDRMKAQEAAAKKGEEDLKKLDAKKSSRSRKSSKR